VSLRLGSRVQKGIVDSSAGPSQSGHKDFWIGARRPRWSGTGAHPRLPVTTTATPTLSRFPQVLPASAHLRRFVTSSSFKRPRMAIVTLTFHVHAGFRKPAGPNHQYPNKAVYRNCGGNAGRRISLIHHHQNAVHIYLCSSAAASLPSTRTAPPLCTPRGTFLLLTLNLS
jgi:hypothetical protein